MRISCQCCGVSADFSTPVEAHDAGWDLPPFSRSAVVCELCPLPLVLLGHTERHAEAHARWEREGRPQVFSEQFRYGDLPTKEDGREGDG